MYGPLYPKPNNFAASAALQTALANVTTYFDWLDSYPAGGGNNSYSIQIFSGHSSTFIFDHHHAASTLANTTKSAGGATTVNGDTVYRIGSLTKIFTMYLFLLGAGDQYLYRPITDFVPELATIAASKTGNAISKVSWSEITIAELASHTAGIASDSI